MTYPLSCVIIQLEVDGEMMEVPNWLFLALLFLAGITAHIAIFVLIDWIRGKRP